MLSKRVLPVIATAALLTCSYRAEAADLLVPSQFATIQTAIDASANGDTVLIAPGTYQGPIDLKGKAIVVRGSQIGAPSATTISGGSSVVRCTSGEGPNTIIENLTITGGTGTVETLVDGCCGPTTVRAQGAGVCLVGSSPVLRHCRIVANTIDNPRPSNQNDTWSSQLLGAGVFISAGSPRLENCLIAGNRLNSAGPRDAAARGGGVCIIDSSALLQDCSITGNSVVASSNPAALSSGGGVHVSGSGTPKFERCSVTTNSSVTAANTSWGSCSAAGGGVALESPSVLIDCRISENTMSGCGGNVAGIQFLAVGSYMSGTRVCGNTGTQLAGAYINLGGNSVTATCPSCAGDLNGDNQVNGADLGLLLGNWGPCPN
jgi:hypothetical protein